MRARSVLHLAALGVFLAGLLTSAGGERNPYHVHIVIGGTQVERTRALAAHLLREEAGASSRPVFGEVVPGPLDRATRARVFSLQRGDDRSPAVWSGGGAVDFLVQASAHIPPPPPTLTPVGSASADAPQLAGRVSVPPPRSS